MVVPAIQVDRGSSRNGGKLLEGNRHFVASHGASAQKNDSGYVRARTERARSRPGEIVEVLQPGLAPNDVGPGRDSHRNDVNSRGREHRGNGTPRHISVACAVRAWRAGRACRTSRTRGASGTRRTLRSGGSGSSLCAGQTGGARWAPPRQQPAQGNGKRRVPNWVWFEREAKKNTNPLTFL